MPTTEQWQGRAVLIMAHVAGMIDLVALPVWVGTTLIGEYRLSPPVAGGMVTSYLLSAAFASLIFAPRFNRLMPKLAAFIGYASAAVAFGTMILTNSVPLLFLLHVVAGFSAGTGLSFTHGTIGRSTHPHRLFAIVTFGMGLSGILFLGLAQTLIPRIGGYLLFLMFAALMAAAAVSVAIAFPTTPEKSPGSAEVLRLGANRPIAARIWWTIMGVTTMAIIQAMTFSFVERIGVEHGFVRWVSVVLIASALFNLAACVAAGLLERRFDALKLALWGVTAQATLALTIVLAHEFFAYAIAGMLFVSTMIVTHTFVFGWIALHDTSGRAVAFTPAMLMSGAAIGPLAGGVLVSQLGTSSLAIATTCLAIVALAFYAAAIRRS